jgi:hypothetical protein
LFVYLGETIYNFGKTHLNLYPVILVRSQFTTTMLASIALTAAVASTPSQYVGEVWNRSVVEAHGMCTAAIVPLSGKDASATFLRSFGVS